MDKQRSIKLYTETTNRVKRTPLRLYLDASFSTTRDFAVNQNTLKLIYPFQNQNLRFFLESKFVVSV
jgi:hypothetical protein